MKFMNGLYTDILRDRFVTKSQIASYSTRNQLDIDIGKVGMEGEVL